MRRIQSSFALAAAGSAVLLAAPSWAVVRVVPGGVAVSDSQGQPLSRATISLTFNDETVTGETDDDGVLGIHISGSRTDGQEPPEGAVVLPGDGTGTIRYEGGPAEGVPFTVENGVLSVSQASAASGSSGGGLGTREYAIGGGLVTAGMIAFAASGGGDANGDSSGANSAPTVTGFYGNYSGTLSVTGTTITGCGTPSSVPVPLTLSGNSDGSGFVLNKGGLVFRGVIRPDGSFEVLYEGPISGFAGLPDNTGISWRILGDIRGNALTGTGQASVTGGSCDSAVISTTTTGTKSG